MQYHLFILPQCCMLLLVGITTAASDWHSYPETSLSPRISDTLRALLESYNSKDASQLLSLINHYSSHFDSLSGSTKKSSSAIACDINKSLFPDGYIDPSRLAEYTLEEQVNWSTDCQLPAACFVKPKNTLEVAVVLKVVTALGTKFAVRNGGHSPNVGFASTDGSGVLIDLRRLNTLSLSGDHKVLQAGTGNNWGDVQTYLDPLGLSAVGGRYLTVGISGLILGGGLPIIPSLYGMACDNVQEFEVVLGDSSVVNANAQTNSDLFAALKGGGNNFGIVTRFSLYTTPLHQIWYKRVEFNGTDYEAVLKATVQVQHEMENDDNAGIIFNAGSGAIQVTFIYGQWTAGPPVFKPLDSLTPVRITIPATNGTVLSFSQRETVPEPRANRASIGVTSLVDADLYTQVYHQFLQLQHSSSANSPSLGLSLQQFGKAAVTAGTARGGNILGNQPTQQTWWSALTSWTDPADASASLTTLNALRRSIESIAQRRTQSLPFIFANDALHSQNVMASYGAANLARMKAVSAKYDSRQVFQTLQSGGWLVSKA